MEITKKDLQKHCMDAMDKLRGKMENLDGKGEIAFMLTIMAFTSILSERMFPEEKKGE